MRDDTFFEGANRISVDIRDRVTGTEGALVGPGPISSCLDFTGDVLLNQPGSFTARFPANDPRLAYLELKRHRLNFHLDGHLVFFGLAESWSHEINEKGERILVVSGRDMLGELAEVPIKAFVADNEPRADIPRDLILNETLVLNGISWGYTGDDTATLVYGDFAGESVLSALTRIAERTGESFRLYGARGVWWLGPTPESSGVRAIQTAADPVKAESNPHVCFIQRLTERRDASQMITTIYPTGAGLGETQLDLEGPAHVVPSGFDYDAATNSITSESALTHTDGLKIGKRVNFKEIRPLFNTDADIEYAKRYLFDVAVAYLRRNDSVDDFVEYDLEVIQLPKGEIALGVQVGTTIRVIYQDDYYDLDTDLVVLGIRTTIDSSGTVRYILTVATTNQWHLNENNHALAQIEEGEIFTAHPQIDANTYWENFREEVGDSQTDHIAEFPFWLSAEVVTIRQVLFRYNVGRILTGTNSYAYDNANTDGSTATNTGNTAVTTDATSILIDGTAVTTDGTSILIDGTTVTVNPLTGGAVSESVVTTTDATSPDSFTETNHLGLATATQGALSSNPTNHSHDIGTHVHDFTHSHTTTTHSHIIDHGHSTNAHSHTNTAHLHTSDAHSHTNTAHLHTSTTHSHTMTHTHPMADLVETFGVTRVPALNSYVMADLEYSVNGGAWASLDLGTPVAGGYYELDITSEIQNPNGLRRPMQEYNLVEIRRKSSAGTGKSALIRAKLGIRATIQSIVTYA